MQKGILFLVPLNSHKKREGRHEVLRSRGRNFYPKCDLKGFQTKRERAPSQLTWNEGVRGKGKKMMWVWEGANMNIERKQCASHRHMRSFRRPVAKLSYLGEIKYSFFIGRNSRHGALCWVNLNRAHHLVIPFPSGGVVKEVLPEFFIMQRGFSGRRGIFKWWHIVLQAVPLSYYALNTGKYITSACTILYVMYLNVFATFEYAGRVTYYHNIYHHFVYPL